MKAPSLKTILIAVVIVLCLVAVFSTRAACTSGALTRFNGRVADSQAGLGADAAKTTAGQVQAEADNAAQTGRNREVILDAENANDSAGDAGDRGLRALCERVRYRDSVRCVELRRADRPDAPR